MAEPGSRLQQFRWVVILIYAVALIAFPLIGQAVHLQAALEPELQRLLPVLLAVAAAFEYAFSLYLERQALVARPGPGAVCAGPAVVIVSAACGASIAVYGLVLALLGLRTWPFLFYLLSLLHGIHLAVRWPDLERLVAGDLQAEG